MMVQGRFLLYRQASRAGLTVPASEQSASSDDIRHSIPTFRSYYNRLRPKIQANFLCIPQK